MPDKRYPEDMEQQELPESDDEGDGSGRGPWIRILLFLILLAALSGLALLALTGADPAAVREQGIGALFSGARDALGEELPRQQTVMSFPEDVPAPVLGVQGELALLLGTGELRALDEDGVERWIRPVQLQTPFMCVEGRDVLYADLSGRAYGVVRDGTGLFEKQSPHPLYNAWLSRDFILLLQRSEDVGYSAVLDGLSREGGAVFTSYLTDYAPFLVRQAPHTAQNAIILSGLSTQIAAAGGAVEFMAPDTTRLGGISSPTDVFSVVLQLRNGTTALVGETGMHLVDRDLLAIGSLVQDGNPITSAALLDNQYPVLSVLDAKRYETTRQEKTWLRVFNETGVMKREWMISGRVAKLVTAPDLIAAMTDRQVVFYDAEGLELTSYEARERVSDVVLTAKGKAYVMADGELTLVRVKQQRRWSFLSSRSE